MQRLAMLAGIVHDIGKGSVPEYILEKPNKLTKAERHLIEHHSIEGESMLIYLAEIVRHHHENHDGSGYPDGLDSDDIPMIAKIIHVTDAYNAMTSDRTYRKAMSPQEAIKELERCSGTQFDPVVVKAFVELLKKKSQAYRLGQSEDFDNVVDKLPG